MLSKLDAVNAILSNLGVASVTSLTVTNVDVRIALNELEASTISVQQESWWFNTEYDVELTYDNEFFIYIPSNVLSIDTSDTYGEVITQRGTRLYSVTRKSYVFDYPVKVNITYALEWDLLPYPVRLTIQYAAMEVVQANHEGDPQKLATVQTRLLGAYNTLKRENLRQQDVNAFQSNHVRRILRRGGSSYNPNYPGGSAY